MKKIILPFIFIFVFSLCCAEDLTSLQPLSQAPDSMVTYESSWFEISPNSNYILTHNLQGIPTKVFCYISDNSDGNNFRQSCWITYYYSSGYSKSTSGTRVKSINKNNVTVSTGSDGIDWVWDGSNYNGNVTSGYCKVVLIK